jgi:hypothetical protein
MTKILEYVKSFSADNAEYMYEYDSAVPFAKYIHKLASLKKSFSLPIMISS